MGFYGNITNTARTQFQFDRTYPNRYEMDKATLTDGIYAGRYVLVEYDMEAKIPDILTRFYPVSKGGKFVASLAPDGQLIKLGVNGAAPQPGDLYYSTPQVADPSLQSKIPYSIYVTEEGTPGETAYFRLATSSDDPYVRNYNIDIGYYGQGRGYDSSVWQKVYTEDQEKYVMIAELNTVVPTFDVAADAPTMNPIVPHFDINSTDVYYKLHWQAPWGFRVKEATTDDSDEQTEHTTYRYNAENGTHSTEKKTVDAAIFFNKPAFNAQVGEETIIKHATQVTNDEIKLTMAASGNLYNKHDGTTDKSVQNDIQELTVHLPSIGNMMSDAWDIIHGPNRDDDMRQVDENGNVVESLQGRLDSIAAMNNHEIPIKRASDGRLVGTQINGNNNKLESEIPEILDEELSTSQSEDDAWIYTKIDADKVQGTHDNHGIAIHHTFHATEDSTSSVDKNDSQISKSGTYKADDILVENLTAERDKIHLYTPYVDAAGHVVGKNVETVTLPYSYRTYKTDGAVPSTNDLYTAINNVSSGNNTSSVSASDSETIADRTQDTLVINPANKWIQTKFADDELVIAHEIHAVDTVPETFNLNTDKVASSKDNDKLTIQYLEFDNAGHVIKNRNHTYTLPYGFKTVTATNSIAVTEAPSAVTNNQVAEETQDTLNLVATNRWIKLDTATEDTVKFGHKLSAFADGTNPNTFYGLIADESVTSLDADNKFEVPCLRFDEAGHILEARTHTVTLPENFDKISVSLNDNTSTTKLVGTVGTISADTLTDTLNIAEGNRWINIDADPNSDKLTFSHYVDPIESTTNTTDLNTATKKTIPIHELTWDAAGHITSNVTHTYTIPDNFKTVSIKNNGNNLTETNITALNSDLVAETMVDTVTFDTGNRWIQFIGDKDTDKVTMYHAKPGEAPAENTTKTGNEEPDFGATFEVPEVKYDEAGHISAKSTHTVKIPLPSINANKEATTASVLTGIQLEPTTCAITQTNANVGTLALTGYTVVQHEQANADTDLAAKDTINEAFSKLQTQIYQEEVNRANADKSLTDDLNAEIKNRTDADKTLDEAIDTEILLRQKAINQEIVDRNDAIAEAIAQEVADRNKAITEAIAQEVIDRNGAIAEEVTNRNKAITQEVTDRNEAIAEVIAQEVIDRNEAIKVVTDGLGTAAAASTDDFAPADILNTQFDFGDTKQTIAQLFNIVADLQARIVALEKEVADLRTNHPLPEPEPEEPETPVEEGQ